MKRIAAGKTLDECADVAERQQQWKKQKKGQRSADPPRASAIVEFCLQDLPNEVIVHEIVLRYLRSNVGDIGKFGQTCKQLASIVWSGFTHLTSEEAGQISNGTLLRMTNLEDLSLHDMAQAEGGDGDDDDDNDDEETRKRKWELAQLARPINDWGLRQMVRLTELSLYNTNAITGAGIETLTALTGLNIDSTERIRDHSLSRLSSLRRLSIVDTHRVRSLKYPSLANLTYLDMTGNEHIGDDDIAFLTNLKVLIGSPMLRDETWSHVTNLETLAIDSYSLGLEEPATDAGLSQLAQLRTLVLPDVETITDAVFKSMNRLTRLSLVGNMRITDAGLWMLPQLEALDITGIHPKSRATFFNVGIVEPFITDAGLASLAQLKELSLKYNTRITDKGIRDLTNLTALDLTGNANITDAGLARLDQLKRLDVRENGLVSMSAVLNMQKLQWLACNAYRMYIYLMEDLLEPQSIPLSRRIPALKTLLLAKQHMSEDDEFIDDYILDRIVGSLRADGIHVEVLHGDSLEHAVSIVNI